MIVCFILYIVVCVMDLLNLSYSDFSLIQLLVNGKLAELCYDKSNGILVNDIYFNELCKLSSRLDNVFKTNYDSKS